MATNSIPGALDNRSPLDSPRGAGGFSTTQSAASSWTEQLQRLLVACLTPLASLRLTVGLLAVSVFVVWVATLEQTRYDIWTVKQLHFPHWFVRIPLQTFFPPAWFPTFQQVPGAIYLPSGFLLIVAMLLNLTAAHVLRMRVQARGSRLWIGLVVFALAAAVTWAVVFSGQNAEGFQVQPPVSYHQMWLMMQVSMWGIVIVAAVSAFRLESSRKLERVLLTSMGVVMAAVLFAVLALGEKSFLGDSAMRVLWQLIQASVAGLVAMVAAALVFKQKAGMVVIHLGIAMLLVNEIYVSTTNEEQQMMMGEGDKTAHTVDIRSIEMVIADTSNPDANQLITVPKQKLITDQKIDHPELPFVVEVLAFYPNSEIVNPEQAPGPAATQGIGLRFAAVSIPVTTGTEMDAKPDQATAYVKLYDRQTQAPLGVWMMSQVVFDNGFIDEVTVAGKAYKIGLRYKHIYKPYMVELVDAQRENYLGTNTPKWFASEFLLTDESQKVDRLRQVVSMNNPLRYRDETFYQSRHWTQDTPAGKRDFTSLQIVRNKGWMIPYVACMYVVVGLIAQFGTSLVAFLEKRRKTALLENESKLAAANSKPAKIPQNKSKEAQSLVPSRSAAWPWLALILFGLAAGYALSGFGKSRAPIVKEAMRLDRWGQLPVTFGGRVQPLDSLARNLARQLGNRETVVDQFDKRQPAVRWLADLVYEATGYDQYAVMRIDDLNVLGSLGLPIKKGFKYSLAELESVQTTLDGLIAQFAEVPEKDWNNTQKRLQDVRSKLNMLFAVRLAFGNPRQRVADDQLFDRWQLYQRVSGSTQVPLAIPQSDPDAPWTTLTRAYAQADTVALAKKFNQSTITGLAKSLTDAELIQPARDQMIRERMIDEILQSKTIAEMLVKQLGIEDIEKLRERMLANWELFPRTIYDEMLPRISNIVDSTIAMRIDELYSSTAQLLQQGLGSSSDTLPEPPNQIAQHWMLLEPAFRNKDANQFNSAVDQVLAAVKQAPPTGYGSSKVASELLYNGYSPFYMATLLYFLAAAVSGFGWIRWPQSFNQAATWILGLAVAIHVFGIVLRVIISGRAPVTNLYSSFIFVSAAAVVLLMVVERLTRLGIGNFLAGLIGAESLLWAWSISIRDGDTFTVLQAVLDTQFWLSTHVIVISLGYAATIAAGFLGIAFLFGSLLSRRFSGPTRRLWVDLIYGVTCFALLCSFFGTVLGGLWADDSWGRFWGWDPKENGALMIVLWNAVLLHARWAGLVKQTGIAVLAILGNVVTIWSWEGVNQLGQGLHSYGFSEDRLFWVGIFVVVNLAIASLAFIPQHFHRSTLTQ